jgi:hypothetical protein
MKKKYFRSVFPLHNIHLIKKKRHLIDKPNKRDLIEDNNFLIEDKNNHKKVTTS